jgi:nicotinate-nucleotide adenylyltransferase
LAKRTAIFGGSFNPIHYGHLLVADQVVEILGLDRLLFVPAAAPPHKSLRALAPAEHRLAMVKLATAGHPRFAVSDVELQRATPSYTVDTVERLASAGDALHLLLGSDTFLDLLSWHAPHRLPALARLVVVPRTGSAFDPDGAAAKKVLQTIGAEAMVRVEEGRVPAGGTLLVHAASLPLSASDIRERVREGRSLAYRLPPEVIAYIEAHHLYRDLPR